MGLLSIIRQFREEQKWLEKERVDPLTTLYKHEYFVAWIRINIRKLALFGTDSLIVIKVINLDMIRSEIGPDKTRDIQEKIGKLIKGKLRWRQRGGYLWTNEFSVFLPGILAKRAVSIAEGLRDDITKIDFGINKEYLKPVLAIGVSSIDRIPIKICGQLLDAGRAAMNRALENGFNKVCLYDKKIDGVILPPLSMDPEIAKQLGSRAESKEVMDEEIEFYESMRLRTAREKEKIDALVKMYRTIAEIFEKRPCTANYGRRLLRQINALYEKINLYEYDPWSLKQDKLISRLCKIKIPESVWKKAGRISDEEKDSLYFHVAKQLEILNKNNKEYADVFNNVKLHLERLDGSGPLGLKQEEIPFKAQITAVADVFEHLTRETPNRKALSFKEGIEELLLKPEKFNPKIVTALKKSLEEKGKL